MTTGLDDFKSVLKEFRSLSIWAGASSIPFVAAFAGVTPPFPKNIEYITAVCQLLVMMYMYQVFTRASAATTRRIMSLLLAASTVMFFAYLFLFSQFTIRIPGMRDVTGMSDVIIIGYQCSPRALEAYGEACPFLGIQELKGAQYNEFELWTKFSLSTMRTVLTSLWCLFFAALAAFVGQFLVFQRRRTLISDRPQRRLN
jgi:hypothetical protein